MAEPMMMMVTAEPSRKSRMVLGFGGWRKEMLLSEANEGSLVAKDRQNFVDKFKIMVRSFKRSTPCNYSLGAVSNTTL
jgi:hypothetical protein